MRLAEIVATYDLPPSKSRRVLARAQSIVRRFKHCSFDKRYEIVADVVEENSSPRARLLSSDFIDRSVVQEASQVEEDVPYEERADALELAKNNLPAELREFLAKLLSSRGISYLPPVTKQDVDRLNGTIISRIEAMMPEVNPFLTQNGLTRPIAFSYFDGKNNLNLVWSRRKYHGDPAEIVRLHGKPVSRQWLRKTDKQLHDALSRSGQLSNCTTPTNRSYGGNPLDYFHAHYRLGEISKSELRKKDLALYQALWRANKLDFAFPSR